MTPADTFLLDAKQAILVEQHRRFEELRQAGHWPEAMHQFHATLVCASDLLTDSLALLEHVLESQRAPDPPEPDASSLN